MNCVDFFFKMGDIPGRRFIFRNPDPARGDVIQKEFYFALILMFIVFLCFLGGVIYGLYKFNERRQSSKKPKKPKKKSQ